MCILVKHMVCFPCPSNGHQKTCSLQTTKKGGSSTIEGVGCVGESEQQQQHTGSGKGSL